MELKIKKARLNLPSSLPSAGRRSHERDEGIKGKGGERQSAAPFVHARILDAQDAVGYNQRNLGHARSLGGFSRQHETGEKLGQISTLASSRRELD